MKLEQIDSWDPFDYRPRKSGWQSLYIGLTGAMIYWSLILFVAFLFSKGT